MKSASLAILAALVLGGCSDKKEEELKLQTAQAELKAQELRVQALELENANALAKANEEAARKSRMDYYRPLIRAVIQDKFDIMQSCMHNGRMNDRAYVAAIAED